MLRKFKRLGALVALGLLAGLLVPGQAKAATVYEVEVFQSFFEEGVPGFSARFYPGSIKVHKGDTIKLNEMAALFPEGVYPQDWIPENLWRTDGRFGFVIDDPDDGANAVKINMFEGTSDCQTAENPCVWTGGEADPIIPIGPAEDDPNPDYSMTIVVDANPGTVLWANSLASSEINTNLRVEVVAPNEPASTQAELDARAAALKLKDREDAHALHTRMNSKRTSHVTASGQKVYDVFVGAAAGPIELFASYPKRIRVPKGARVQYHFMDEVEPHTATFGGSKAKAMFENGFIPVCDPDGDAGPGPDTEPNFGPDGPPCAPPAEFEVDIDNRVVYETGDGRVNGREDYENSGLKAPIFPEETDFDANPWTVRMTKESNDKGYKYICLVHGGFMGGRVVVK